jgi:hypothetical protein
VRRIIVVGLAAAALWAGGTALAAPYSNVDWLLSYRFDPRVYGNRVMPVAQITVDGGTCADARGWQNIYDRYSGRFKGSIGGQRVVRLCDFNASGPSTNVQAFESWDMARGECYVPRVQYRDTMTGRYETRTGARYCAWDY